MSRGVLPCLSLHLAVQQSDNHTKRLIKGMFLYSAVASPLDRSKHCYTLNTSWKTCSFWDQLDFSVKHSSHAAITREDYSLTFPPLFIARYSFIQLNELGCHGENENAQT